MAEWGVEQHVIYEIKIAKRLNENDTQDTKAKTGKCTLHHSKIRLRGPYDKY